MGEGVRVPCIPQYRSEDSEDSDYVPGQGRRGRGRPKRGGAHKSRQTIK